MAYNIFVPQYIARSEQKRSREIVTYEDWNELFNLNITQGDHSEGYLFELSRYLFGDDGQSGRDAEITSSITNLSQEFLEAFEQLNRDKVDKSSVINSITSDDTKIPTSGAVARALVESGRMPIGGQTGEALIKLSNADYDWGFKKIVPDGGEINEVLTKLSDDDQDYDWKMLEDESIKQRTDLEDITICSGIVEAAVGVSVYVPFKRKFFQIPNVVASIISGNPEHYIGVSNITKDGFYVTCNQNSFYTNIEVTKTRDGNTRYVSSSDSATFSPVEEKGIVNDINAVLRQNHDFQNRAPIYTILDVLEYIDNTGSNSFSKDYINVTFSGSHNGTSAKTYQIKSKFNGILAFGADYSNSHNTSYTRFTVTANGKNYINASANGSGTAFIPVDIGTTVDVKVYTFSSSKTTSFTLRDFAIIRNVLDNTNIANYFDITGSSPSYSENAWELSVINGSKTATWTAKSDCYLYIDYLNAYIYNSDSYPPHSGTARLRVNGVDVISKSGSISPSSLEVTSRRIPLKLKKGDELEFYAQGDNTKMQGRIRWGYLSVSETIKVSYIACCDTGIDISQEE